MSDTPTRLKTIQEGDEGVVERAAHALKKGELREHGRIAEIRDELQRPAVRETLLELRNCSTGLKPNSTALVPSWSGRWAR